MLREIRIENYKSILDDTIELGRINVFIGANGSGKTNILEALAMVAASKDNDLNVEGLYNRGARVTKPSLTFSSFAGSKSKKRIKVKVNLVFPRHDLQKEQLNEYILADGFKVKVQFPVDINNTGKVYSFDVPSIFYCENEDDIYAEWKDQFTEDVAEKMRESFADNIIRSKNLRTEVDKLIYEREPDLELHNKSLADDPVFIDILRKVITSHFDEAYLPKAVSEVSEVLQLEFLTEFLIYTLNTQALRGIVSESKKQPLGINGEGLDILLANFDEAESERIQRYNYLVSWLDELVFDEKDVLKYKGHKLGRSTSILYFKDKFMRKNNNVFSAENANEGALHILFYLALFISKKTPQLFAIDNIETALNPRVCRTLVKELAQLAKENNKQALITTHNPAILDGLDLNDDEQRLFVVYRTDEGHTKTKRIKLKPETKEGNLKLSELWMRGHLGGLPNDF
jgi:AAA15 family ATPase/GTPase